jgi:hypothetical protein
VPVQYKRHQFVVHRETPSVNVSLLAKKPFSDLISVPAFITVLKNGHEV